MTLSWGICMLITIWVLTYNLTDIQRQIIKDRESTIKSLLELASKLKLNKKQQKLLKELRDDCEDFM